ncbi:MAG: hypothetical protein ACE141_15645 [Bryobacteraceae bacterium]
MSARQTYATRLAKNSLAVVKQSELRSLFALQRELDAQCKAVRRRIDAGANVQAGRLVARSEGDDPIYREPVRNIQMLGLVVAPRA